MYVASNRYNRLDVAMTGDDPPLGLDLRRKAASLTPFLQLPNRFHNFIKIRLIYATFLY